MSRTLLLVLSITISAVCVLLSIVDIAPKMMLKPDELRAAIERIPATLQQIATTLAHANALGFASVMAITILAFWVRALRWRFLVRADRPLPMTSLFSATMIGFMANNILPFRLGEFVRPWALARHEGLSKSMLLATILVERVIDMLTLLAIFGIALWIHPIAETMPAGRMVQAGVRLLMVLTAGLTVFVVVAERNRSLAHALVRAIPGALGASLGKLLDRFLDGFSLFRDIGRLAQVFVLSFVMFLSFSCALWITSWSLGIELPWYAGLVMLVVTAIGIMVPAAPGYVGTLNIACTAGLGLYGVTGAPASAFGWFYFFSQWLPITAVGLWFLNRAGLSLKSLGEAQGEGA